MKKKLFIFILLLICIFSFNVFAESSTKLTVKSGDGTKSGNEVCIEDQCFYVIENNGETATLLSKYNLYTGWVYNYEDVYQETTNRSERDAKCYDFWSGSGCYDDFYEQTGLTSDNSYVWTSYQYTDDVGKIYYRAYYFTFLDTKEIKQTSEAIGLHGGDENNRTPEFPEVAVFNKENSNISSWEAFYLNNDDDSQYVKDGETYSNSLQDFKFKRDIYYYGNKDYKVLSGYEDYLDEQGLSIKDINILSLTDLNNIAKSATGSYLPLDEWVEGKEIYYEEDGHNDIYLYGSLKEELGNDYSWLWSTTYWLRTFEKLDFYPGTAILFVESIGNVCSDLGCYGMVGAGIRPVITVDSKDIVKPKQDIIVNPETGGIVFVIILGLIGIGFLSLKLKNKTN